MNAFQHYDKIRQYQLHCNRLDNVIIDVPNHEAYSPIKPKLAEAREFQRQKRQQSIEKHNEIIMEKLIRINNRKSHCLSSPNLSLPPISRKHAQIPQHQDENNNIAQKIINSKPSISTLDMARKYRTIEKRMRNISKYDRSNGMITNRQQQLAEMFLIRKMRESVVRNHK